MKHKKKSKKTEILFDKLLNRTSVGYHLYRYVKPDKLLLYYANKRAKRIVSTTKKNIVNKPLQNILPALGEQKLYTSLLSVMKTGKPFTTEIEFYSQPNDVVLKIEAQRINKTILCISFIDITDLCNVYEELDRTSKHLLEITKKLHAEIEERKLVEKELRRAEELFTKAFRASPDSININRLRDGLYIAINEGFTKLTGYTEEDVKGKTSLDINIWANPEDRKRLVQQLQQHGRVKDFEALFKLKDGRVRTGVMSAAVVEVYDEPCIISITRDIHEQKELVEKQRIQEQRYGLLFESSPDPIVVIDEQLSIKNVNLRTVQLWGANEKDFFYGKTILDFIVPEERHIAIHNSKKLIETGIPHTNQYHIIGPNGKVLTFDISVSLFPNENSTTKQFIAILHNVTEKKKLEQELMMLGQALKSIHDSVVIVNTNGLIIFTNKSFENVYGYQKEEIIDKPLQTIFFEGIQEDLQKIYDTCINEGEWKGEQIHKRIDGSLLSVTMYMYPIVSEESNIVGFVSIIQDLTESRRNEEILRKIARGTSLITGLDFFKTFVPHLASIIKMPYTAVAQNTMSNELLFLAVWNKDSFIQPENLSLTEEECKILTQSKTIVVADELSDGLKKKLSNHTHYSLVAVIPLIDDNNEVLGMIIIADESSRVLSKEEISVLKIFAARARAELQRVRAEQEWKKLLLAVEYNPIAIAIIDNNYCIEYVNPQFTALTGYALTEIKGQTIQSVPLEQSHIITDLIQRASKTHILSDDVVFVKKDRGTFLSYVRIVPIMNKVQELSHYILLIEDVSYQKRIEERLKSTEQRYREVFENDITADFTCTPDGVIIDCNHTFIRMFAFQSFAEAHSTNLKELYNHPSAFDTILQQLRLQKKLINVETEMKNLENKILYAIQNLVGVYGDDGVLQEIRGYIFNDTERRQLEMQIRQSQKMELVGTLAGGIAHDFNNILNNIIGFSIQIKKHLQEPEKITKYCDTIEKSASRGAQIAGQLLQFSKLKDSESDYVDLENIIAEVATLARETFPKEIEIQEEINESLKTIVGDRGSLYEVLLNLAINARDAMPQGGVLTFRAKNLNVGGDVNPRWFSTDAQECICLEVIDTGIGIPEENIPKIFDPFFTTKEKGKGTGLGLSIVYNAVKSHGGSVFVESIVGKGTKFSIYLPVKDNENITSTQESIMVLRQSNNECILIVDDEEPMLFLGKEILEEQGYRVITAKNGVEAIEIYRKEWQNIDLVILDLIMPLKDGGKTYIEMKEINPHIKAFFCTGFTSDKVITQLLEHEKLYAIQKPFRNEDLLALITKVLES